MGGSAEPPHGGILYDSWQGMGEGASGFIDGLDDAWEFVGVVIMSGEDSAVIEVGEPGGDITGGGIVGMFGIDEQEVDTFVGDIGTEGSGDGGGVPQEDTGSELGVFVGLDLEEVITAEVLEVLGVEVLCEEAGAVGGRALEVIDDVEVDGGFVPEFGEVSMEVTDGGGEDDGGFGGPRADLDDGDDILLFDDGCVA